MRLFVTTFLCSLSLVAGFPRQASAADPAGTAKRARPNIIFILADDLGHGDLGCYGGNKIRTPHLDQMAAEGMRFDRFYAGSSVCAPSRCTLMTGLHTGHTPIRDNAQRAKGAEGQRPMQAGTKTVAEQLRRAGYATGIIGKWGLGMPEDQSSPLHFGFDYHYGYLCQSVAHTFYPPHLWRNNVRETLEGNPQYDVGMASPIPASGQVYAHDLMANDALRWVREQADRPFFLYLAFTIPHLSLQVPADSLAEYLGKWPETPFENTKHYAAHATPRAAYAAMITRMDRDIGRLQALLKELGLDERTLVLFASDNGAVFPLSGTDPVFFESNRQLRGYKQDLYEGGIRTPMIARWPGMIQPGTQSDHIGAFWDVMPTLCEIAGTESAGGIDGISFAPTLLGRGEQKQHESLYWEYHAQGGRQAVRMGKWKAVKTQVKTKSNPLELFDLEVDPGEKINVAEANPEVVARIAAVLERSRTPSDFKPWNF